MRYSVVYFNPSKIYLDGTGEHDVSFPHALQLAYDNASSMPNREIHIVSGQNTVKTITNVNGKFVERNYNRATIDANSALNYE